MLKLLPMAIIPLMLVSCAGVSSNPSVTPPTKLIFNATLSSANEVPAVKTPSNGSGSVVATLEGTTLTVTGSFKGLTGVATLAHLHGPAAKTASATVLQGLTFTNDATVGNGALSGSLTLTPDQITAFKAGLVYVNVHTAANTAGEVRGQLELPSSVSSSGGYGNVQNPSAVSLPHGEHSSHH